MLTQEAREREVAAEEERATAEAADKERQKQEEAAREAMEVGESSLCGGSSALHLSFWDGKLHQAHSLASQQQQHRSQPWLCTAFDMQIGEYRKSLCFQARALPNFS
jgi:hypothetical protein